MICLSKLLRIEVSNCNDWEISKLIYIKTKISLSINWNIWKICSTHDNIRSHSTPTCMLVINQIYEMNFLVLSMHIIVFCLMKVSWQKQMKIFFGSEVNRCCARFIYYMGGNHSNTDYILFYFSIELYLHIHW